MSRSGLPLLTGVSGSCVNVSLSSSYSLELPLVKLEILSTA